MFQCLLSINSGSLQYDGHIKHLIARWEVYTAKTFLMGRWVIMGMYTGYGETILLLIGSQWSPTTYREKRMGRSPHTGDINPLQLVSFQMHYGMHTGYGETSPLHFRSQRRPTTYREKRWVGHPILGTSTHSNLFLFKCTMGCLPVMGRPSLSTSVPSGDQQLTEKKDG
jgi:hypothetical protein